MTERRGPRVVEVVTDVLPAMRCRPDGRRCQVQRRVGQRFMPRLSGRCADDVKCSYRRVRRGRAAMDAGFDTYKLTDEHEMLRDTVRQLAEDKIAPRAA